MSFCTSAITGTDHPAHQPIYVCTACVPASPDELPPCVCEACAADIAECPLCRSPVRTKRRIYFD